MHTNELSPMLFDSSYNMFFFCRKLAGLNKTRSSHIVEYRKSKGPFVNREQLKQVKGIGPKTFEQCAGFIKILPQTLEAHIKKYYSNYFMLIKIFHA